jgi:hypothetical protein
LALSWQGGQRKRMRCESCITLMGGGQRGEDVAETEWGGV